MSSKVFDESQGVCCDDQNCNNRVAADYTDQLPQCEENSPLSYEAIVKFGGCRVPDRAVNDQANRRQHVSFTVPNPVASSASSRRRMDKETGAAKADFGTIIKLSSSSFAAPGPFLLFWATTTLTLALVAGWSL